MVNIIQSILTWFKTPILTLIILKMDSISRKGTMCTFRIGFTSQSLVLSIKACHDSTSKSSTPSPF